MAAGGWGSLYAKLGNKFCQMSPRAADSETRLPPSTQKFGMNEETQVRSIAKSQDTDIALDVILILGKQFSTGIVTVRPPGRVHLFIYIAHSEAKS